MIDLTLFPPHMFIKAEQLVKIDRVYSKITDQIAYAHFCIFFTKVQK